MDYQTLLQALTQVLSAESTTRREAEQFLTSLQGAEGLFPLLCQVAFSDNSLEVRHSAVLFLKNCCKDWKDAKHQQIHMRPVPESDQLYLRTHIVALLTPSVDDKLRVQFEEIAKLMAEHLFPEQWQEAYGLLDGSILAGSTEQLYAGLTLLHLLVKAFERNATENRSNLQVLTARYFGRLQQYLLQLPLDEANFPLLVLILKTYYTVTYIDCSINLGEIAGFDIWIGRIKELLEAPLGVLERQPDTAEEATRLEKHPAWMCKRYCAQIVQRCFQRTAHFREQFCVQLVTVSLDLLLGRPARWVPDTVATYLWKLITHGVKVKETKSLIHSKVQPLLSQVLLTQVCRVPLDQELWHQYPVEFIRRENDMVRALYSAKAAAVDFLITVCADRNMLQSVLGYLEQQFQAGPVPLHKEAFLLLFGSLAELIAKDDYLCSRIEQNLESFVYPDLASPNCFLRARAVSVYGMCASAPILQTGHQENVLRQVCQLLEQPELPVQIEAAITLAKILAWPCAHRLIEPEIKRILEVYLNIMKVIDSEELINSMETLVLEFQSAVAPCSIELTRELTQAFERTVRADSANQGSTVLAAASILNTLVAVLETARTAKKQLCEVSSLLLPVLQYILSPQGTAYLEEGLSLLDDLLYYPKPGSLPHLFPLFPLLIQALVGSPQVPAYASEHIELTFVPLANFISKYNVQFLASDGVNTVLQTAHQLLSLPEETVGYEYHLAVKLLLCLLENYPQELRPHLAVIETLALSLVKKQKKAMRLLAIELFGMLCRVNPLLSQHESLSSSQDFVFETWVKLSANFSTESGKMHSACGLLWLIIAYSDQSESIKQRLPTLFQHLIRTLYELKTMKGTVVDDDLPMIISKLKVKTKAEEEKCEDQEEEQDDWSPIDEDRYESPITLKRLLSQLKQVIEKMRGEGLFEALAALLEPRDWQKLESLDADSS